MPQGFHRVDCRTAPARMARLPTLPATRARLRPGRVRGRGHRLRICRGGRSPGDRPGPPVHLGHLDGAPEQGGLGLGRALAERPNGRRRTPGGSGQGPCTPRPRPSPIRPPGSRLHPGGMAQVPRCLRRPRRGRGGAAARWRFRRRGAVRTRHGQAAHGRALVPVRRWPGRDGLWPRPEIPRKELSPPRRIVWVVGDAGIRRFIRPQSIGFAALSQISTDLATQRPVRGARRRHPHAMDSPKRLDPDLPG